MTKTTRSMLTLAAFAAVGWMGVAAAAPPEKAPAAAAKSSCCSKAEDGARACPRLAGSKAEGASHHDRCAKGDHSGCPQHGAAADCPHPKGKAAAEAVYSCPMHPEVTSATKGRCPKCKMFLEPAAQ